MASKRKSDRADSTANLIQQLRDELHCEPIPEGWMSAMQLADAVGVDINTLHRRLKKLGFRREKYHVPGTRAGSVWCYRLDYEK